MAPELFGCHDRLSSKSCFCFGVCAGLHGAFLVRGVRVRRGGLVGHTGLGRGLSRGVLLCSALGVRFVQRLRDQVQHEVSLGELFAGAERFTLEVTFDALEEFFGNLECHGSAFFSHLNAAFLIFHHVVIVLDEVGDVLAGGLAQPFPIFADPLVEGDGNLSTQVFCSCHLLDSGRVDRIEAKKKPKGLAPKTVRNIHQMIGSAYNLAIEQHLVTKNPTQGCALPKVEHKEMKTLTADQLSAFFQEARDSGVYELYYLDLATGLRRGELLGLKWTDVDLDRGVLKIQRAISRQNGKVVEAPLKTKNAYRTLPLSADAIDVLVQQRRKTGNSEWVFPSPAGGPMSPDSVLHMLQRVLKRAGLPRIRFHDLRHTFATLALQNRVDVKTVSSMLGHYSAGFTLDTYAHVTTDAQLKAAQTMRDILSRAV